MPVSILAFGIAKEIFGQPKIEVPVKEKIKVNELKQMLEERYPALKKLAHYLVAVNDEYASDEIIISEDDEVAIIPPVSGG